MELSEIDMRRSKLPKAAMDGDWARMRPVERQRVLLKLADLIEANGEELAQLETLNNGKSVMLSRLVEVGNSSNYLRYMAGWSTKIEGVDHRRFHRGSAGHEGIRPIQGKSRSASLAPSRLGTSR